MDSQGDTPEFIIKHRCNEYGEVLYYVKWLGCDYSQNTWESEQVMKSEWPSALKRYREKKNEKEMKDLPIDTPDENDVKFKAFDKIANWEEAVECVTFVEHSKLTGLIVYLKWKNGTKSIHHSSEVYQRCPQKMLDFFESHAEFEEIAM